MIVQRPQQIVVGSVKIMQIDVLPRENEFLAIIWRERDRFSQSFQSPCKRADLRITKVQDYVNFIVSFNNVSWMSSMLKGWLRIDTQLSV